MINKLNETFEKTLAVAEQVNNELAVAIMYDPNALGLKEVQDFNRMYGTNFITGQQIAGHNDYGKIMVLQALQAMIEAAPAKPDCAPS